MSEAIKDGGPAFPTNFDMSTFTHENQGMALRDYFAAAALQGMLAYSYVSPRNGNWHENSDERGVAVMAYMYADAMLEVRK